MKDDDIKKILKYTDRELDPYELDKLNFILNSDPKLKANFAEAEKEIKKYEQYLEDDIPVSRYDEMIKKAVQEENGKAVQVIVKLFGGFNIKPAYRIAAGILLVLSGVLFLTLDEPSVPTVDEKYLVWDYEPLSEGIRQVNEKTLMLESSFSEKEAFDKTISEIGLKINELENELNRR